MERDSWRADAITGRRCIDCPGQHRSHSDDDFTATADQALEKTAATRFDDDDDDEDDDDDADDADDVRVNACFPVTIALQALLVGMMASIFRLLFSRSLLYIASFAVDRRKNASIHFFSNSRSKFFYRFWVRAKKFRGRQHGAYVK